MTLLNVFQKSLITYLWINAYVWSKLKPLQKTTYYKIKTTTINILGLNIHEKKILLVLLLWRFKYPMLEQYSNSTFMSELGRLGSLTDTWTFFAS